MPRYLNCSPSLDIVYRSLHNVNVVKGGYSPQPRGRELCMARPRGFDETVALDAAIECFRQRGYEATSVRDLTACMGIGPTSLYNTFGDKRALFVKALERYVNCTVRARLKRLESSLPPKEAVRTLIEDVIAGCVMQKRVAASARLAANPSVTSGAKRCARSRSPS